MQRRYIGPYVEGVTVRLEGQEYGPVKPGEVLVIPDEMATKYAWNESDWETVRTPKTK